MAWPSVKLKDSCTVVGGATPKRNIEEYWGKDVPWITPKDISQLNHPVLEDAPEYISQKGYESCATHLLPKGSVLLTSRAPIGNVAIAGREMCTNQGFKSLVPGDQVDGAYLYHCMKFSAQRLDALGNGATFKEVSKKVVEEFEIPLPPLTEQKRIAAILDKADAIRRKRQQAIQLADEFLRSVFLDMFGDPVTNPRGWEVICLGDLLGSGITNGMHAASSRVGQGIHLFDNKGIYSGLHADFSRTRLIDATEVELEKYGLHNDDIIMNRVSVAPDGVGKTVVVRGLTQPCVFESNMMRFNLNQTVINPIFFVFLMSLEGMRMVVKKLATIANQASINQAAVKSIPLIVPPIGVQEKFCEIFEVNSKTIAKEKKDKASQIDLFNSLSQQAFAGQL